MTKLEEKQALCNRHRALLEILLKYGTSGVMPLPQLRALCLVWGLYPSAQAINRAVRELRAADILNRQTWVDNNSDLLLARKFVWRYFAGKDSQETATPRRPATMAPYILQARKIDWLLSMVEREHLATMEAAETYLRRHDAPCSSACQTCRAITAAMSPRSRRKTRRTTGNSWPA